MSERVLRWAIRVLSTSEWAEAMVAEADHLPQGSARRKWLAGAAFSALTHNPVLIRLGLLAGICAAGALVSQALWRTSELGALFTLVNELLAAVVAGLMWLTHRAPGWRASGFVAAVVAGVAAMPFDGPMAELGLSPTLTLALMMASVGAVVAVTIARMVNPDHVTRATMVTWMWAAVLTFVLGIASGMGAAA